MAQTPIRLKTDVITQIKSYKKAVRAANIPIAKMIVFGSQAKGTAHKWSDIDLAVVSPQFGKDYFDELGDLMRIRNRDNIAIEPHPLHPDDLNDRWSTLAQEIKEYGIEV